ncbi:MAG: hypothetical protein WBN60_05230, partial [Polyangiales bacterium]
MAAMLGVRGPLIATLEEEPIFKCHLTTVPLPVALLESSQTVEIGFVPLLDRRREFSNFRIGKGIANWPQSQHDGP